jgi:hypothetical protein
VTDVGMTGPGGGMQGYHPDYFVASMKTRLPSAHPLSFATGSVELGAVMIRLDKGLALSINRLT